MAEDTVQIGSLGVALCPNTKETDMIHYTPEGRHIKLGLNFSGAKEPSQRIFWERKALRRP
jgi:hypothetical protein